MGSIQIWHVVVTGIEGVSYFKVPLNSHEFKFFHFSIAYNEGNSRNFIQVLHVYVRLQ